MDACGCLESSSELGMQSTGGVSPVGRGLLGRLRGMHSLGGTGGPGQCGPCLGWDERPAVLWFCFCSWMLLLFSSYSEAEGFPKYILIPSLS